MKISKKILIEIGVIIVLVVIIYNFYILNNSKEEIDYSNIIINNTDENKEIEEVSEKIKVYITGAVKLPGVLELEENSRIEDAINLAGGITESANISNVNLAYQLEDGQKIYIPNINDKNNIEYLTKENGEEVIQTNNQNSKGKININKSTLEELETLPGVGEALGQRIITYREKNGKFKTIEDLKNVSGIGEKKFESLKEYIDVK